MLATAWFTTLSAQGAEPKRGRPEVIRTAYGVPHVYADDFWQAGYGLAWVELEDYGARVAIALVDGRGERGLVFGHDSIEADFGGRQTNARARAMWPQLSPATRDMYQGFAAAVNDYIAGHRQEFVPTIRTGFNGWDVLANEIPTANVRAAARLLERRRPEPATSHSSEDGSNAWALAPSRTKAGHAILLRNPHLDWDAGYYEAHLVVRDQLDFYGDFRIGGAFAVVGGFNHDLGWATTNNAVDTDELYQIPLAKGRNDRIVLDGRSIALTRRRVTVPFRTRTGVSQETREFWSSPFGPVVDRRHGRAFVLKAAGAGEYRGGEQFLRMMRARSFAEWESAMKLRARITSNLTYADRAGNIFYVWNGALPALPHPPGRDSTIIQVRSERDMWQHLVPWDSLPQIRNPPGGYLHNENDSPHFASLEAPLDPARLPANVEAPSLGLRGQHALDLIGHAEDRFSLEDVVRLKHSYRMLLAERILPDLLAASIHHLPAPPEDAMLTLRNWDRTSAPNSRGGVLFETWWRLYQANVQQPFATPWSIRLPTTTPSGLANPGEAVNLIRVAADSVRHRFSRIDVSWGEAHRIRIGTRDMPVGGCRGDLGCFRVLWYRDEADGKLAAQGGDGWILAVEFGDVPRAYSVLAYGESSRPDSPWFGDQAKRFAEGDLKSVPLDRATVEQQAVRRYHPGAKSQ